VNALERKLKARAHFRDAILVRDGKSCRVCGSTKKVEVHRINGHILVQGNALCLCHGCRVKAEYFAVHDGKKSVEGFHPDDLYKLLGTSKAEVDAEAKLLGD
jgi:hypothetical protein